MTLSLKKTADAGDNFLEYDENCIQRYHAIRESFSAGYSKRQIAIMLHCSRNTVNKYVNGEFDALCGKNFRSGMESYYDYVIKSLRAGMSRKDIYRSVVKMGYGGGQTAAYDYMNKVKRRFGIEVSTYKSTSPEAVQRKKALEKYDHLSRTGIFRFLWMSREITAYHKQYLFKTYPKLKELYVCIKEFRQIFDQKNMPLLYLFIDKYKASELKELATFAKGLDKDINAIENAVASKLSNGFVEGCNSKLKMIKRTMYGRCSQKLLAAKLMYR